MSLPRILIDLNDSEGRVAVVAELTPELDWVHAPGRRAARLADRTEGLL